MLPRINEDTHPPSHPLANGAKGLQEGGLNLKYAAITILMMPNMKLMGDSLKKDNIGGFKPVTLDFKIKDLVPVGKTEDT